MDYKINISTDINRESLAAMQQKIDEITKNPIKISLDLSDLDILSNIPIKPQIDLNTVKQELSDLEKKEYKSKLDLEIDEKSVKQEIEKIAKSFTDKTIQIPFGEVDESFIKNEITSIIDSINANVNSINIKINPNTNELDSAIVKFTDEANKTFTQRLEFDKVTNSLKVVSIELSDNIGKAQKFNEEIGKLKAQLSERINNFTQAFPQPENQEAIKRINDELETLGTKSNVTKKDFQALNKELDDLFKVLNMGTKINLIDPSSTNELKSYLQQAYKLKENQIQIADISKKPIELFNGEVIRQQIIYIEEAQNKWRELTSYFNTTTGSLRILEGQIKDVNSALIQGDTALQARRQQQVNVSQQEFVPKIDKLIESPLVAAADMQILSELKAKFVDLSGETVNAKELIKQYKAEYLDIASKIKSGELQKGTIDISATKQEFIEYISTLKQVSAEQVKVFSSISNIDRSGDSVKQIVYEIRNVDGELQRFKGTINATTGEFREMEQATRSGFNTNNIEAFQSTIRNLIGEFISFQIVLSQIREAFEEIKNVDSQLVSIQKVTGATTEEIKSLEAQAYATGSEMGRFGSEYLKAVSEFSRAGYGEQSKGLAELSLLTQNVGDVTEETANKFLLATDAAYKLNGNYDALLRVVDGLNEVSNKNATSVEKLAEAIEIAGVTFSAVGLSAAEMTGYIATATAVTQASGRVIGTSFRTVLQNINQIKGMFDGEVVDEDSMAKAEKALNSIGISIREYKDGVWELRGAGVVLKDLSDKWETLSSVEKSVITEGLGGKRHANTLTAIMENYDQVMEVQQQYTDSVGSAMQENEFYMDSIEAKTAQLKNTWIEFIAQTATRDMFKGVLDAGTSLIKLFDNLKSTTMILAGVFLVLKSQTIADTFASIGSSASAAINTIKSFTTGTMALQTGAAAATTQVMSLNAALGVIGLASMAIGAITALIANLRQAEEERKALVVSDAQGIIQSYYEQSDSIDKTIKSLEDMESRYKYLSKGVSEHGENISLTNEEYSEYLSILKQIEENTPEILFHYDEQGRKIYDNNNLIRESIALLKEKQEAEKQNVISDSSLALMGEAESIRRNDLQKQTETALFNMPFLYDENFQYALKDIGVEIDNTKTSYENYVKVVQKSEELIASAKRGNIYLTDEEILKIRQAAKVYEDNTKAMESSNEPIREALSLMPQFLSGYEGLSDSQKAFLQDYSNNLTIAFDKTGQGVLDAKSKVESLANIIINNDQIKEQINKLFALDFNNMPVDEYKEQYNKLINDIVSEVQLSGDVFDNLGNQLSQQEIEADIKTAFKVDLDESFIDDVKNKFKDKFKELANYAGQLSKEELSIALRPDFQFDGSSFEGLKQAIKQYTSETISAATETKELESSIDDLTKVFDDLSKLLKTSTSNIQSLVDVQYDLNKNNKLTADSISRITQLYPEAIVYANDFGQMQEFISGKISEQENIAINAYMNMLLSNTDMLNQIVSNSSELPALLTPSYNADVNNFAQGSAEKYRVEAQTVAKLSDLWAKYAKNGIKSIETTINQLTAGGIAGTLTPEKDQLLQDLVSLKKVYDASLSSWEAFKPSFETPTPVKQLESGKGGKSSSSKAKEEKDTTKERYAEELALLKIQLEEQLISEREFLNASLELNDKYFKGKDKFLVDYKNNYIDANKKLRELTEKELENELYMIEKKSEAEKDAQLANASLARQLLEDNKRIKEAEADANLKQYASNLLYKTQQQFGLPQNTKIKQLEIGEQKLLVSPVLPDGKTLNDEDLKNYVEKLIKDGTITESEIFVKFVDNDTFKTVESSFNELIDLKEKLNSSEISTEDLERYKSNLVQIAELQSNEQLKNVKNSYERQIEIHKEFQNQLHEEADKYRAIGFKDTDSEIQELQKKWAEHNEKIKEISKIVITLDFDLNTERLTTEMESLNHQMSLYNEYDFAGKISTVTFQMENQRKSIEENKKQLENLQKAYLDGKISANDFKEMTEDLNRSINDSIISLKNYEEQIRKIKFDDLSQQKEALSTIIDYVKNLIKQRVDDSVKAIKAEIDLENEKKQIIADEIKDFEELIKKKKKEADLNKKNVDDQLKGYKAIIDAKKKELDLIKENNKYTKDLADKQKEIANLQEALLEVSNDDSLEGRAKKLKLEEQLQNKNENLDEFLLDNDIKKRKAALDEELKRMEDRYTAEKDEIDSTFELYEQRMQERIELNKQEQDQIDASNENRKQHIEHLQESIRYNGSLTRMAMDEIDERGDLLYQDLLEWNKQYGTGIDTDISQAWERADDIMKNNVNTMQTMVDLMTQMYQLSEQIAKSQSKMNDGSLVGMRDYFTSTGRDVQWNSENRNVGVGDQWFDSSQFKFIDDRIYLTMEQIEEIEKKLKNLPKFHSGGEVLSKLQVGETVINRANTEFIPLLPTIQNEILELNKRLDNKYSSGGGLNVNVTNQFNVDGIATDQILESVDQMFDRNNKTLAEKIKDDFNRDLIGM